MAASKTVKTKSIFDLIGCIFQFKTKWEDLTESDQKQFSPYMINRFISMDPEYVQVVNYLQQYTLTGMRPREVYKLYLDLLPKRKFWSKYIKSKTDSSDKISNDLVEFISKQQNWSTSECKENLEFLMLNDNYAQILLDYLKMYGVSADEARKKYKIK